MYSKSIFLENRRFWDLVPQIKEAAASRASINLGRWHTGVPLGTVPIRKKIGWQYAVHRADLHRILHLSTSTPELDYSYRVSAIRADPRSSSVSVVSPGIKSCLRKQNTYAAFRIIVPGYQTCSGPSDIVITSSGLGRVRDGLSIKGTLALLIWSSTPGESGVERGCSEHPGRRKK